MASPCSPSAHLRKARPLGASNDAGFLLYRTFCVSDCFLELCPDLAAPSRAAAQDYSFTIPGTWGWLDTNIELYPGDRVHITGAVIDCAGPTPTEKLDVPLPSAPVGTLLAKLHAETQPCPRHPRRRIRHNRAQPPLSRRERLAMPRKNSCQGARGTPRCRDSQALSGYLCN